jgi:hypothetical protein
MVLSGDFVLDEETAILFSGLYFLQFTNITWDTERFNRINSSAHPGFRALIC